MAVRVYPKGSNEKLSQNFRACEFDCKCSRCTETKVDELLVEYLQKIRDHFGKAVHITGPYRCPEHNAETPNASKTSRHMQGMAADFQVDGVAPAEVAAFAERIGVLGIGLYDTFVHIDTRTYKSFWFGHGQEKRDTFLPSAKSCSLELPVLAKGGKGETVKAVQLLLLAYGYSCGKAGADGIFGTGTEKALTEYQRRSKLPESGKTDAASWKSLLGVR